MRLRQHLCTLAAVTTLAAHIGAAQVIIDNDDGFPAYVEIGSWTTSGLAGYNGLTYRYTDDTQPPSTAIWTPTFGTSEDYEVYAIFLASAVRTTSAPYTVHHVSGETLVSIDQSGPQVITERFLGEFPFTVGTSGSVEITNSGLPGFYAADAIRFAPAVNDPPVISGLKVSPELPSSSDSVYATALIIDPDGSVASAELTYSSTPMGTVGLLTALDDGIHGDGAPGDGVFGAQIPLQPQGDTVIFQFQAADDDGLVSAPASGSYLVGVLEDPSALTFIIAGQSNASGRGELDANTETPDASVLMFGNDYEWHIASEPVDDPTGQIDSVSDDTTIPRTPQHGFGLRAGKDLVAAGTSSVRLIPCAMGATTTADWRRPLDPFNRSTLFGSMNHRRQTAASGELTALWWYQGESDAGSTTYLTDHADLVAEMRAEMGTELPIVYAQLARSTSSAANDALYHAIGESQRQLEAGSGHPASLPNHHLVVTFDLGMKDGAHLNQAGYIEAGRRFALSTREHVLGHSVDGTGPRLVTHMPAVHPLDDLSRVRVDFDREINTTLDNFGGLFTVQDDGADVPIAQVVLDPGNPNSVLITLSTPIMGTATVTYGLNSASTPLLSAVMGTTALPTPRFGPLEVILESVPAGLTELSSP